MKPYIPMNNLSQQDKIWAFDYLIRYENEIKRCPGHFHIEDNAVVQFMNENDIYLNSLNQRAQRQSVNHRNFCIYEQRRNSKVSGSDKAHHFLRHIRNCIAHGLLRKERGLMFILRDIDQNSHISMMGRIKVPILQQFIDILIQTKR